MKPIITEINSMSEFKEIISRPEIRTTILKLSATWCAPCQRIAPLVHQWTDRLPNDIQVCFLDIDVSMGMYSYLKSKRLIKGVPALLRFDSKPYGFNDQPIPDDLVMGSDLNEVNLFFERVMRKP
jgi:thiol-disulfide isomerase/thioredoxin